MTVSGTDDLAQVDVAGVLRDINVGLLAPPPKPGEYILIHCGFALEMMTEDQARDALAPFGPQP
ncbi:HypC/HybG/HupF family hydrogenase formation chaperone [Saccharopolyspora phatthalungensis]|uniref:Hydrogenase expression/formation protein HypC n=1 Tax=Saccharopolyspora phatthalungensis TaxID=664693 RepID=A0A840QER3_9PSEU|nr:HypC/HybG/HupF family hydrogenase formation chaperone [Saccharopolyspora phatthalungensis]MBB5157079.1 hydrogenase expression/formation protein HypC [Saccharopolyspora phatthalungensis]